MSKQDFRVLSRVSIKNTEGFFVILSIKKDKVKIISDHYNEISKVNIEEIEYVKQYDIRGG